jgi:hypothetical protein
MASPLLMAAAPLIRVAAITLLREGAMMMCLERTGNAKTIYRGLKKSLPALPLWILMFVGRGAKTTNGGGKVVCFPPLVSSEKSTPHALL